MVDQVAQNENQQSAKGRLSFSWNKAITLFLLLIVVCPIGIWFAWRSSVDRRLDALITSQQQAGKKIKPAEFESEPIADERNAVTIFVQGAQSITIPESVSFTLEDIYKYPRRFEEKRDQIDAIVRANREFFEHAKRAAATEDAFWKLDLTGPLIQTLLPNLPECRAGAKLLAASAELHLKNGKTTEGLDRIETLLAVADHVRAAPVLIQYMVSMSMDSYAIDALERAGMTQLGDNDRATVHRLIQSLLDHQTLDTSWTIAMQMEKTIMIDSVTRMANGTLSMDARNVSGLVALNISNKRKSFSFATIASPAIKSALFEMVEYADDAERAGMQTSYTDATREFADVRPTRPKGLSPAKHVRWTIQSVLMPSLGRALYMHFRTRTIRVQAATALAIQLYEHDTGQRPASLEQLVPKYLPTAPVDPFAPDGEWIRYLPDADHPCLYSVGSNGVDDGGAYQLRKKGGIDADAQDMPFFLDGKPEHIDDPSSGQNNETPE